MKAANRPLRAPSRNGTHAQNQYHARTSQKRTRRPPEKKRRNINLLFHRLRRIGLALGSAHPGSIFVAQETLGFRWFGFSPNFMLLIPTFALLVTPPHLPVQLQRRRECSSTACSARKSKVESGKVKSHADFMDFRTLWTFKLRAKHARVFGTMFKPRYIFGATQLDE